MAIVNDGILGPFSNKVGTVVGRKFRGLDVMTGLYEKKTFKPATASRLQQQDRFSVLNSFLNKMFDLVEPGFKKYVKKGQSPVNAAFSYNFPQAFNEGVELNYPKLVYSRGPVERPNGAAVEFIAPATIRFSWWPQPENVNSRHHDKASFLVCNAAGDMLISIRNAQRGEMQFEIKLLPHHLGRDFHCYMSFSDTAGKLNGTSEYVGLLQTAALEG